MGLMSTLEPVRQFLSRHVRFTSVLDQVLRPVEHIIKVPIWGCHMCGQCVLHSTGLVCPMNCPKNLRNGPCGGVRLDGHCEVKPEMVCVWVKAYASSQHLPWAHEMHNLQPPVDWALEGSSSWVNLLTGRDQITSGCLTEPRSALQVLEGHGR